MAERTQRDRAYSRWRGMIQRCTNPEDKDYQWYGGRGITVDPRWLDFATYYADTGDRPFPDATIDRWPNADGPYSPENTRWATWAQQRANQRDRNAMKTHCPQGHPYAGANLVIAVDGSRQCRECRREAGRKRYMRLRAPRPRKTHCPQGHEYTEANTRITPSGGRSCRTCDRESSRRSYRRQKLSA